MLSRRDFLTALLGTAAAAAVLPQIELLATAGIPDAQDAIAWRATFSEVHAAAFKQFQHELAALGAPLSEQDTDPRVLMIGQRLQSGPFVTRQFNVTANSMAELPLDELRLRTIEPAMKSLANRCVYSGTDRFAMMRTGMQGCDYTAMMGPLRMVVHYAIEWDVYLTRFDVLGGSSPDGLRRASRFRGNLLKREIQNRLASGYGQPLPIPA